MGRYQDFAKVYDALMGSVNYQKRGEYLLSVFEKYGQNPPCLLDLGCGTGNMTALLDAAGYDMIGVDNSEEMLEIAMEKKMESGHDILYLLQTKLMSFVWR
mgnify:CR=1 FL=1